MLRRPALAVLVILTLAFGIGLTTAMFSIVNGVMLRGLPFPEADRILYLSLRDVDQQRALAISSDTFRSMAERQRVFEETGAFALMSANVVGPDGTADRYAAARVTPNMFRLLRAAPARGRAFMESDGEPGAAPVVIIGHKLWVDVFGGVIDIVGSTLRVNGTNMTVVGVMPNGFRFPQGQDVWLPLDVSQGDASLQVIGRLKEGTSSGEAEAALATVLRQIDAEAQGEQRSRNVQLQPYVEALLTGGTAEMIYTMLVASLGVLLIACVNVANLILSRGTSRVREMAVRASVGAGRWRLIRQLLVEVLVLTAVGAAAGTMLAYAGIVLFNAAIAETQPPFWIDIRIDYAVLGFVVIVSVAAVLIAGLVPALRASRFDLRGAMSEEARGSTTRIGRFSRGLVIFEVALSCGLAVASALIIQGIVRASRADFGFAMHDVWHGRLILPGREYAGEEKRLRALEDILSGLYAIPGVESATLTTDIPWPLRIQATPRALVKIEGRDNSSESGLPQVRHITVSPEFFDVLRVKPIDGRAFGVSDTATGMPVAIVNASFARTFFQGSAVGRTVAFAQGPHQEWRTIVGVVPDLGIGRMYQDSIHEAIYLPMAQMPPAAVRILIHTTGSPLEVTRPVREVVRTVNPDMPVFGVSTLEQTVRSNTWPLRIFGTVFVAFGLSGLVLAAIGLYGVVAHAVSLRTQEIGVRIAMGAKRGVILRMVLKQGLAQILIGAAFGVWLALALAASLEFLLFGVSPRDPRIFALTLAILVITGILACLVPARRAASVDPMEALRHQ